MITNAPDIIAASKIIDVVSDFVKLKKSGKDQKGECPWCGSDAFTVTEKKNIFKCFGCGIGGDSVKFIIEKQGLKYPEALKYLAQKFVVDVKEEKPTNEPLKKKGNTKMSSFCARQLYASGLTFDDVKHEVYEDDDTTVFTEVFEAGTRDQYGRVIDGDDMIIWYYDLNGKHVTYQIPKTSKFANLFRVRWANPDLHQDKNGSPMKYSSPYGSGSHLYIPQDIRKKYQEGRKIKTLYIEEGEKKAEKACKHGLPSVGIMGINNIASKDAGLPYEFELIIKRCMVDEVVFVVDSDWNHLSENIGIGKSVDSRCWSFYGAVKNFKKYFTSFQNQGLYLELYFAHVVENEAKEKGIDDLLSGTLKEKELDLYDDFKRALVDHNGDGQYVKVHKITTITDGKLLELWGLQSNEAFVEKYKDQLINIPVFELRKHKYRFNEAGVLELAQPLQDDEKFWEEEVFTDKFQQQHTKYVFRYKRCKKFLFNRGYGRLMMADNSYSLCKLDGKVVRLCDSYEIKDFVMKFAETIAPEGVEEMLLRGAKMYLGPDSLSNLDYFQVEFEESNRCYQKIYFKNMFWKISAQGVDEFPLSNIDKSIWSEMVNDFVVTKMNKPLVEVQKIDEKWISGTSNPDEYKHYLNGYAIEWSKEAENCDYLNFLYRTSNFAWEKCTKEDIRDRDEIYETEQHFIAKLSGLGYLLHEYFDAACPKAVVSMDGRNSEVGASNGGTGKSIFGDAIGYVIPQTIIGGKVKKIEEDPFWAEEVNEKTRNVFIDDARANIDFEFLFPCITGRFVVNRKGKSKFTLPKARTPKIYLSTNHSVNGEGSSFKRRQFLIAFSDYYNENHSPIDDFGKRFFDDWDADQWNLFYNLMANCLHIYFQFGLIDPPMERLEMRRIRQYIGEVFLYWADEFYAYDEEKERFLRDDERHHDEPRRYEVDLPRKDVYENFLEKNPKQRTYSTPTNFKKKLKMYVSYRGGVFNPHVLDKNGRQGGDCKTGGTEFFRVANKEV
jgi:DNA primase